MYRVLAVDMDDTLLGSDGMIGHRTMGVLADWLTAGRHIIIATGRPPRSVAATLPALLADVPWICYNGAEVRHRGETVHRDLMSPEAARQLVRWGMDALPDWRIGVEVDDVLYLNRRFGVWKEFVYTPELEAVCLQPAAKVLFSNGTLNQTTATEDERDPFAPLQPLLEALPAGVRPMLSERYRLAQFMSPTADKAVALQRLVSDLGLTLEDVVAFGDDVNDVDMLRASGLGVAVSNAVAEVHAVADRVTASNDEEGVAIVLANMLEDDSWPIG